MITAFVLINVDGNEVHELADRLLRMSGITEVHVVAGEYDMVAVVRVPDNRALSSLLTKNVIHAPGVHRTKTLISLESFGPSAGEGGA